MGNWNPELYQEHHSFVWRKAADLVDLLNPTAGERILDAGCGTGQLTAAIAGQGAEVVGVDRSEEMIEKARENFPGSSSALPISHGSAISRNLTRFFPTPCCTGFAMPRLRRGRSRKR